MTLALDEATEALRHRVLSGAFTPDAKLREATVAEEFGVSRTIARLAMSSLENEGLLTREPNRGSKVRHFTIQQICDAIEVRGELEAMAVRQAAERGLTAATDAALGALMDWSAVLVAGGARSDAEQREWSALNQRFHDLLIEASGNWALKIASEQMARLPLVSPSAVIFERADPAKAQRQLALAHADHQEVLDAVRARQPHRAEARMREHAVASARNKRSNLVDPETMAFARGLPGGPLIRAED